MLNKEKLRASFIIPVYNVEQYLRQCVESITSQTYSNFEIILVDDGSKDSSPGLCDQLASEDSRIFVIHKDNGGLSDARNTGLQQASGNYVVFIDSDDFWLGKNSLEILFQQASLYPELDFIGFNCQYFFQEEGRYKKWPLFPEKLSNPITKDEVLCELSQAGLFAVSACMKFIRRDFIIENGLFFKTGQLSEDIPWFINLMDKVKKCVFINDYIYSYRQVSNGPSITHSIGKRNIDSILEIIDDEINRIESRSFGKDAKEALFSFLAYELIIAYAFLQYLDKSESTIVYEKLTKYKWLLSYTKNPKVKKVYLLTKLLGIRLSVIILQWYLKHSR